MFRSTGCEAVTDDWGGDDVEETRYTYGRDERKEERKDTHMYSPIMIDNRDSMIGCGMRRWLAANGTRAVG